jgi:RNA polymerase sigma factor (sigma-70 family)
VKLRLLQKSDRPIEATSQLSFEQTVLPHLDSAHNLARWLTRDAGLAEDIVQDAFVRALRHFSGFRGGDARAWLMQIVRNVAYTALSTRTNRAEVSFEAETSHGDGSPVLLHLLDPSDDPEAALTRHQDMACLERQLSALPLPLRECLVLRELEELSYKQIADITGVPVGTVMSRLWRARQALMEGQSKGREL